MTDVLLHPAPGRAAGAWRRPLCRGRPGRLAPASAAAAAPLVRGLDQLPPAGAAELTLFSPSKINLFLRVVRRREDGYHDLASLFCVTDFGDTLGVSRSPSPLSDTLVCDAPGVPLDASNLVVRAFDLFRRKTGSAQRFWAHLAKRVPAGAGLGGGSGNAATALWAANVLCGNPATEAQLLEWAGEIGSDISVFFSHGAAYCTGRGEVVRDERAPLPGSTRLALVKPQDALLTPAVFKALQLGGRSTEEPEGLLAALRLAGGGPGGGDRGALQALAVNDLEAPAFALLPSLGLLKARLMADGSTGGYEAVFMSGSGSTLVCLGGGGAAPAWAAGEGLFVANGVRMITRQPGRWYDAPPPPASGA